MEQNRLKEAQRVCFDYSELTARIIRGYGSTERFIADSEPRRAVCAALGEGRPLTLKDVEQLATDLEIEAGEIDRLFFKAVSGTTGAGPTPPRGPREPRGRRQSN